MCSIKDVITIGLRTAFKLKDVREEKERERESSKRLRQELHI